MLVGVIDLLLITMVFSKILRQLKTYVLYFSFVQQMIALKNNYEKCFLLHLKSSFHSRGT